MLENYNEARQVKAHLKFRFAAGLGLVPTLNAVQLNITEYL
ncbi:hypothetical protein QWZ13_17970 [Reinekea marina]|nr:hypothetical protein [Reinekea marina]MDN3650797.1 hypothetical protein [Reinekea marina]